MHRVNVLLDNNAWTALQDVPRGKRSHMINKAIAYMASLEGKARAAKEMDILREKLPKKVSTSQIVSWIREDRSR